MFWDDLLDAADTRMGFDMEDKFKEDAIEPLTFKLASAAQGINMKFQQKMTDAAQWKHKMCLTTKCCDEHNFECTISNKDTEMKWCMEPEGMNKDGVKGCFEVEGKTNFKDDSWDASAHMCSGGFEMGPMKPWSTLKFATNNASEHEVTYTQNLQMDDMNCGWKVSADKSGALTGAYGAMAMKYDKDGCLMYARGDMLHKFFGVGCTFDFNCCGSTDTKHAVELQYDACQSHDGIGGQPLFFRYGCDGKMAPNVGIGYTLFGGKTWMETTKSTFTVNDTTKLTLSARTDIMAFFKDPKNYVQAVGLGVEFKA